MGGTLSHLISKYDIQKDVKIVAAMKKVNVSKQPFYQIFNKVIILMNYCGLQEINQLMRSYEKYVVLIRINLDEKLMN